MESVVFDTVLICLAAIGLIVSFRKNRRRNVETMRLTKKYGITEEVAENLSKAKFK
jgi:hypothetical protein